MDIRKLAPGDRLLDYRILEKIGEGGFGEVFRAEHEVLGRIVAIKVPRDHESLSALRLEGVIQATLDHPSIVKTLEISISHDPPYVVMEHVDGSSLAELLKREGALSWKRAARILLEAGRALKHAHERGVVHGDVKPGNVLVEPGEEGKVRLTDFGLGRVFEGPRGNMQISRSLELATSGAEVQGTLRYLAPEVQRGEPADERSDLYSWGVLLFETLTGKLPEGREVPSDLAKHVPWEIDAVFEQCFQRRERRPRSLDTSLASLERLLSVGSRPKEAETGEGSKASAAIPYRAHDGSALVRPLVTPTGQAVVKAMMDGGKVVTPDAAVPTNPEAARLLEDLKRIREGKPTSSLVTDAPQFQAANAIKVVGPIPAPAAQETVFPVHPRELDLGSATKAARNDESFKRWREAFLASLRASFDRRPAGAALVPHEGFDVAFGVTTEGDPQHRIFAAVVPYIDLDGARRFVRAARAVFEREKGVWEKEVTFTILAREIREKEQVLWTLRSFSTGWWRRRRVVLQDVVRDRIYATELGCDPRGNPLKRLFFDAVRVAAAKTQAPVIARCRGRRECFRGSLVGIGLALVATVGLLGGAISVEKCRDMHRRHGRFASRMNGDVPTMRAAPGSVARDASFVPPAVEKPARPAAPANAVKPPSTPVTPTVAKERTWELPAKDASLASERNAWWDTTPDEPATRPEKPVRHYH